MFSNLCFSTTKIVKIERSTKNKLVFLLFPRCFSVFDKVKVSKSFQLQASSTEKVGKLEINLWTGSDFECEQEREKVRK